MSASLAASGALTGRSLQYSVQKLLPPLASFHGSCLLPEGIGQCCTEGAWAHTCCVACHPGRSPAGVCPQQRPCSCTPSGPWPAHPAWALFYMRKQSCTTLSLGTLPVTGHTTADVPLCMNNQAQDAAELHMSNICQELTVCSEHVPETTGRDDHDLALQSRRCTDHAHPRGDAAGRPGPHCPQSRSQDPCLAMSRRHDSRSRTPGQACTSRVQHAD